MNSVYFHTDAAIVPFKESAHKQNKPYQLIPMKPLVLLAITALVITLGSNCKKSSDDKEPFNLAKTEWLGEAKMHERDFKPMTVLFKENHEVEVIFVPVDAPADKFTFYGTWSKADGSDEVEFKFEKGLETVTSTATLTENNTKMDNGIFMVSSDEHNEAGSFKISKQ